MTKKIFAIIETAIGVVSSVLDPDEDAVPAPADVPFSDDDLRAAMVKAGPRLRNMSPSARTKAVAGIVDGLKRTRSKAASDNMINGLSSMHTAQPAPEKDYSSLGQRIMASRNPHYKA